MIATQRRPLLLSAQKLSASGAVVIAAALFNALLAIVNGNLVQLNSIEVIVCEALIDGVALYLAMQRDDPLTNPWLRFMALLFVINFVNAVGSGGLDPKFLRDVIIIPIFVLLGLTASRESCTSTIVMLQALVLAVMLFEAVFPDAYGRFFSVMTYYINTRGFESEQFWSKDTADLFVSASRPGERYLMPFLNIHRLSSVFLEPVSLGNYCVIVIMALAALWEEIGWKIRIYLAVTTAMLIVGCDGRFASTSIVVMLAVRFIAPMMPRYANAAYLPGMLFLAATVVTIGHLSAAGDDFPTRTAGSIYAISEMSALDLIGGDTAHAYQVMDSGIAYLLYSQSLIGTAAIWAVISWGLPQRDRPAIVYSHATSVYVALNLLVSYSMFSVKTAALLWFVFGSLSRRVAQPAEVDSMDYAPASLERRSTRAARRLPR